jgi:hypothetical protein
VIKNYALIRIYSFLLLCCRLECGVLLADVVPRLEAVRQLSDVDSEVGNWHPHLLHGVQITQGHRFVIESVEIDGNRERDTALVGAGISLTNGLPGVINLGGDATLGQDLLYNIKTLKTARNLLMSCTTELISLLGMRGRIEHFKGAIRGGNTK